MTKIYCPYCFNKETLSIVCNDKIEPKDSTYRDKCNKIKLDTNRAILSNMNLHFSKEYDGKVVKRRTYNAYCPECRKPFYYVSNMLISDIIKLTFIFEIKGDRWKYVISLKRDDSYYEVDHNYITKIERTILTPARKYKIQDGIKKSKLLSWGVVYSDDKVDYKIRWNVYIEFYDGQMIAKGGYDRFPQEWWIFIEPLKRVFKNNVFDCLK